MGKGLSEDLLLKIIYLLNNISYTEQVSQDESKMVNMQRFKRYTVSVLQRAGRDHGAGQCSPDRAECCYDPGQGLQ